MTLTTICSYVDTSAVLSSLLDPAKRGRGHNTLVRRADTLLSTLVSQFNQRIPDFIRTAETNQVEPLPARIPVSSVRLVHPVRNPKTGVVRDVIVRQLKPVNIMHDRPTRTVTYARVIPGENVRVPWPRHEPRTHPDHAADTKRLEVEERTFVPTLLRPPVPEAVLDELRNRYSKFRTRHTPEYVAQKEAEEAAKQARKKSAQTMLLPVQEYNRKLREQRRALGQPVLTDEMLTRIGEVVARNKQLRASGGKTSSEPVDKLQKAVEQLSLGSDAAIPVQDQDQPTPS